MSQVEKLEKMLAERKGVWADTEIGRLKKKLAFRKDAPGYSDNVKAIEAAIRELENGGS